MSENFPYDLPSREALITLIDNTYPSLDLPNRSVSFDKQYFSPTMADPGRTFVETFLLGPKTKTWFSYSRLHFEDVYPENVQVSVPSDQPTTSRVVVEALNDQLGSTLDLSDVYYDDTELAPANTGFLYRLTALEGSFVFHGSVIINVVPTSEETRYGENGTVLYMEDGTVKQMESGS